MSRPFDSKIDFNPNMVMFDIEMSKLNKEYEHYFKRSEVDDNILGNINEYFMITQGDDEEETIFLNFNQSVQLLPEIKTRLESEFLKFFKNDQGW